jgi:gluconolactonase
MKIHYFIVLILSLIITLSGCTKEPEPSEEISPEISVQETGKAAEKQGVVAPGATVEKLAGGFKFTEGPACDSEGNVFFTDPHSNRIHKWSSDGKLTTFLDPSGGAIGLFIDHDGSLLACAGKDRRLVSIDSKGNITVLADKYNGKLLNEPNDLWLDQKGGIYFSDPYWLKKVIEQDGEHVYYLTPDRKEVIRVINDMVKPNGITGSPDDTLLYVADGGDNKTFVYRINQDGTLSNKKLFAPEGYDGMTSDSEGNVYITGKSISVYDPAGEKIETIEIPETSSNVCFGGTDKKTLYITTSHTLYSIRMRVKGL